MGTSSTHRRLRTRVGRALRITLAVGVCACASTPDKVGSIGAVLSRDNETGLVEVHDAPPGLAADEAGLIAGDDIKMIDGVLVDDLDAARIKQLLRGPVGSKVTLTVIRGDEVLDLEVTRQELGKAPEPKSRYERIE